MHKLTHYERLMSIDQFINPPEIMINGKPFRFTYDAVIKNVLTTYDHNKDVIKRGGLYPHIPEAFMKNEWVKVFLDVHLKLWRHMIETGKLQPYMSDWWHNLIDDGDDPNAGVDEFAYITVVLYENLYTVSLF